jgi:hypothetical protein
MDPYLEDEKLWPQFHHQLVLCLYQILLPGLVDRYRARVGQRHYATEQALFTPVVRDEHQEEFIEIRQRGDGRLVTLVDVASPSNKTTAAGRQAYLEKRAEARGAGANLVEIDLVLQGQPTLDYSAEGLPDWDYAVTVTRASHPERQEIYSATLQKRLPRFRLPLAADDRDTVLDLQASFTRSYAEGGYRARIDYRREPPVPLREESRHWLDSTLVACGLRSPMPSHEQIALVAYYLWEQEGRPHGRDLEHWHRALAQLRHAKPERE